MSRKRTALAEVTPISSATALASGTASETKEAIDSARPVTNYRPPVFCPPPKENSSRTPFDLYAVSDYDKKRLLGADPKLLELKERRLRNQLLVSMEPMQIPKELQDEARELRQERESSLTLNANEPRSIAEQVEGAIALAPMRRWWR